MNPDKVKIRVEHLKKDFGHLQVLQDVSAEICEGEVVVVIGPSGSGKSTFLRCLNQLEEATSGKIFIDGKEKVFIGSITIIPSHSFGTNHMVFFHSSFPPHIFMFQQYY